MIFRKVQGIKYSRVMTLPSQLCDALEIEVGDCLSISLENGRMIVVPTRTGAKPPAEGDRDPSDEVIQT